MLLGCVIDNMVVGGPAYTSQKLDKGDVIVKIDGKDVNQDTLLPRLIGSDQPGKQTLPSPTSGARGACFLCVRRLTAAVLQVRRWC